MKYIQDNQLSVELFVSDRESKWMKNNMSNTRHKMIFGMLLKIYITCNRQCIPLPIHLGFRREVAKAVKQKGCEILGMINHLYWSVMSTTDDNTDIFEAKWLSLANHIYNKYTNHGKVYKNESCYAQRSYLRGTVVPPLYPASKRGDMVQSAADFPVSTQPLEKKRKFDTPAQFVCTASVEGASPGKTI